MIPARRSTAFNTWFAENAAKRIRATFGKVLVHGLASARNEAAGAPLLVVANHTSWWDALVALYVTTHLLELEGYALMDAKNLVRFPFFGLVGAFGVDLGEPRDGVRAIRYASRLLDRPGRAVWLFPQGRERPITERPLDFRGGAAEIARVARNAVIIPAALRYEFGADELPHLYVSFGPVVAPSRDVETNRIEQERAVDAELARIERAACGDVSAFDVVHRATPSRLGDVATAILSFVTRHAPPPLLPRAPADPARRR
jgi:1-acyl-sn-glycerol-3-phosphate acyltransferase